MEKRDFSATIAGDSFSSIELPRNSRSTFRSLKTAAFVLALTFAVSAYGEERVAERKVAPEYPPAAKALRLSGVVKVAITINPAGVVTKAEAKGGNKLLGTPAEEAVRKWKFAAADAESTQEVEIIFKLKE
ncbi:TonB family protein [Acidobacteria bacterium AB60]|nr:TonB family protein [Acidobacteria bacterium AB60]